MGLEGTWYNELGSVLVILKVEDNVISGTYETAVSSDDLTKGVFLVTGRTDINGKGGMTVGFVVTWLNDKSTFDSTTVWAGQYHDLNGEESLSTTWLLVGKTDVAHEWASTLVGEDLFTRKVASSKQQAKVAVGRSRSNP